MAQLVEQRIRNAWVAGSSPASGSLSWYPLDTSFFCITEQRAKALMERPQRILTLKCVNFVNFVNFL